MDGVVPKESFEISRYYFWRFDVYGILDGKFIRNTLHRDMEMALAFKS